MFRRKKKEKEYSKTVKALQTLSENQYPDYTILKTIKNPTPIKIIVKSKSGDIELPPHSTIVVDKAVAVKWRENKGFIELVTNNGIMEAECTKINFLPHPEKVEDL